MRTTWALASIVSLAPLLAGTAGCSDDDAVGGQEGNGATGTEMGDTDRPSDGDESGGHEGETQGDGDGDGEATPDLPPPPPDGPLGEIPEDEWEEMPNPDGVPQPLPGVYDDLGPADDTDP